VKFVSLTSLCVGSPQIEDQMERSRHVDANMHIVYKAAPNREPLPVQKVVHVYLCVAVHFQRSDVSLVRVMSVHGPRSHRLTAYAIAVRKVEVSSSQTVDVNGNHSRSRPARCNPPQAMHQKRLRAGDSSVREAEALMFLRIIRTL
jgi:hypothetical protein